MPTDTPFDAVVEDRIHSIWGDLGVEKLDDLNSMCREFGAEVGANRNNWLRKQLEELQVLRKEKSKARGHLRRMSSVIALVFLPIAVGIFLDSQAMQWAGFSFGMLALITIIALAENKEKR